MPLYHKILLVCVSTELIMDVFLFLRVSNVVPLQLFSACEVAEVFRTSTPSLEVTSLQNPIWYIIICLSYIFLFVSLLSFLYYIVLQDLIYRSSYGVGKK